MAIDGSNPSTAARPTARRTCAVATIALASVLSWANEPTTTKPDPRVDSEGVNPYSKLSNEQLVTRVGTYGDLDHDQRRWFLTELHKRLSAKGDRPRIQVDKDDRFGRVVREVGRSDQASRETVVGTSPAGEDGAATKVYGTGPQSEAEKTAAAATRARQSEDPTKPSE